MTSRRSECDDGWTLAGRMLDRRDTLRLRSPFLVDVEHEGRSTYARCRDLSDVGLKLDLNRRLALGDFVTVTFSTDVSVQGVVVWAQNTACGVAFIAPVDSGQLMTRVHPAAGLDLPATLALLAGREPPRRDEPVARKARQDRIFQPGLAVTLLTGRGREERALVSWAKENVATLMLGTDPTDDEPKLLPSA